MAWLAQRPPAPLPAGLLADPLVAARASGLALRLRNASEAYRFAEGRWPADLDALAAQGWTTPPAMAGDAASPYPLDVSGAGVTVLAPEY